MGSIRHGNRSQRGNRLIYAAVVLSVILLPLAGAALAEKDVREFLRFPPPLEVPVGYVRFSWAAAIAVMSLVGIVVAPWIADLRHAANMQTEAGSSAVSPRVRFPGWGWASLVWTLGWWV